MAKYFGLLICTLAVVQIGYALDCYSCVSSADNKNCDEFNDKDKISVSTCGKTASASFKPACMKKVIEDKTTKMTNTSRLCIIMKADANTDQECKSGSDRYTVTTCEVCMDDLCNGSDFARFNIFTIFGTVVAYLLVKNMH